MRLVHTHCVRVIDDIPDDGTYTARGGPYEFSFLDNSYTAWSIGIAPASGQEMLESVKVIITNGFIRVDDK